jgi:hypothetical protein
LNSKNIAVAEAQGLSGRGQLTNGQEAVAGIPDEDPPIEVEVALGAAPEEARHAAAAVDLRDGTQADDGVRSVRVE